MNENKFGNRNLHSNLLQFPDSKCEAKIQDNHSREISLDTTLLECRALRNRASLLKLSKKKRPGTSTATKIMLLKVENFPGASRKNNIRALSLSLTPQRPPQAFYHHPRLKFMSISLRAVTANRCALGRAKPQEEETLAEFPACERKIAVTAVAGRTEECEGRKKKHLGVYIQWRERTYVYARGPRARACTGAICSRSFQIMI